MFLSKSSLQSLSVTVIVEGLEKLAIARLGGLLLSYKTAKAAMGSETIRVDRNVRKKRTKKNFVGLVYIVRTAGGHCMTTLASVYSCLMFMYYQIAVMNV